MLARALFIVAVGSIVLMVVGATVAVVGADGAAFTLIAAGLIGWIGFIVAVAADVVRAAEVEEVDE